MIKEGNQRAFRVLRHEMEGDRSSSDNIVVFVPGWGSTPFTWRYFLPEIIRYHDVHYFETREKVDHSANPEILHTGLGAEDNSYDLLSYLEDLDRPYFLFLSSSAVIYFSLICESISKPPEAICYLSPMTKFPKSTMVQFGQFIVLIAKIPIFRASVISLMKNFWTRSEQDRLEGILKILENGSLETLFHSARQLSSVSARLESISQVPCSSIILSAREDKLHKINECAELYDRIPNCKWEYLNSFGEIHSSKAANLLLDFLVSLRS